MASSVSSQSSLPAEKRQAVREYAFVLVAYVALFVAVALDVTRGGFLAELDPRIARWMALDAPSWAHVLSRRLTHLGDAPLLGALTVACATWLAYRGRRLAAALAIACVAATGGLTVVLKEAFARPRPLFTDPAGHVHSFSFPSGHASGAFCVYVLCAVLLSATASPRARIGWVTAGILLAAMVSATRVVMPVHYLTDVLAGAAVGLAVVVAGLLAQALVERGRTRR